MHKFGYLNDVREKNRTNILSVNDLLNVQCSVRRLTHFARARWSAGVTNDVREEDKTEKSELARLCFYFYNFHCKRRFSHSISNCN